MNKTAGDKLESHYSKQVHSEYTPLLLSSLVLREYLCGQVDVSCFVKNKKKYKINLFEIKCTNRFSKKQLLRLDRTKVLLNNIFNMDVFLTLVSGR